MNELGVQSFSTKKVEYEKISESNVFKHFEDKNMMLLAVLNFYAKFVLDIIESIKIKALNGVDGVNYFTDAFTN